MRGQGVTLLNQGNLPPGRRLRHVGLPQCPMEFALVFDKDVDHPQPYSTTLTLHAWSNGNDFLWWRRYISPEVFIVQTPQAPQHNMAIVSIINLLHPKSYPNTPHQNALITKVAISTKMFMRTDCVRSSGGVITRIWWTLSPLSRQSLALPLIDWPGLVVGPVTAAYRCALWPHAWQIMRRQQISAGNSGRLCTDTNSQLGHIMKMPSPSSMWHLIEQKTKNASDRA